MSMMYIRNLVGLHLKYYTDLHDVDEDKTTINLHGGEWLSGSYAGVSTQYIYHYSTATLSDVAYKYNKNSTLITGVEF